MQHRLFIENRNLDGKVIDIWEAKPLDCGSLLPQSKAPFGRTI
jgi:hypothetical protein